MVPFFFGTNTMSTSNLSNIDKLVVKARAAGRWDQIALALAPSIAPAIERPGKAHIDCPRHGGKGDFRVFKDFLGTGGGICTCGVWPDGISLIGAINGWSFQKSLSEIAGLLFHGQQPDPLPIARPMQQRRVSAQEDAAIIQRLHALWGSAFSVRNPRAAPFWLYLRNRGLNWPAGIRDIRFHPAIGYYENGENLGFFPGFLSRVVTPDGTSVSIHRTYLTEAGYKAPVEKPKKLCSHASKRPLHGSAIRLFQAGEVLGVAEGIETALAVKELFSVPCWSTLSAELMKHFDPPLGVRRVIVFADRNRPTQYHPLGHGQEAAKTLVEKLWAKGLQAEIKLPPDEAAPSSKGIDWLDVLVSVKAKRIA
jgi:hypothetical protein